MTRFSFSLSQSVRRILSVVVLMLGFLALVASLWGGKFLVLSLIFALLYLVVLASLNRSTSQVVSTAETLLDERQSALRHRAHWLAYKVVAAFALFMLIVNGIYFSEVRITFGLSNTPFATLFLAVNGVLVTALPTIFVAWLEPDPVKNEASAETNRGHA